MRDSPENVFLRPNIQSLRSPENLSEIDETPLAPGTAGLLPSGARNIERYEEWLGVGPSYRP